MSFPSRAQQTVKCEHTAGIQLNTAKKLVSIIITQHDTDVLKIPIKSIILVFELGCWVITLSFPFYPAARAEVVEP
jgi:hypothetical protein